MSRKLFVRKKPGTAPAIIIVSPSLGDKYGGALLTLTFAAPASITSVTIDGTACTNVVQTSAITVTCRAPAKNPGFYDVIASGPSGTSRLVSAYESWHPNVAYPAARAYTTNVASTITSAGSATRQRLGIRGSDVMVGARYGSHRPGPDPAPNGLIASGGTLATDGQGFVELPSGRFILAGGAPAGHAYQVVNTLWKSDDRAKTWAELLPDRAASSTCPAPAHTWGFFPMTVNGTPYVYWLGGDPFAPTGDVFRIPASALDVGGNPNTPWERVSTTCPTSGLALFNVGVLNGVIYVIGGQTSLLDSGVVSNTVYKSTDYGATWTTVGNAPWAGRGAQLGVMPVKDGKLWLVGGARYHTTNFTQYYNDVWTFDGTTWTQVLADGNSQIPSARYHSVVVRNGKLWTFNGTQRRTATPVTLTFSGNTITRSSGSWLDDGFLIAFPVQVLGSTSNNVTRNITNLTATVMTVDGAALAAEGPTASCTVHGLDGDTKTAHYSTDGVTWTAWADDYSWGDTHAQAAIASSDGIYLTEGFQTAKVHVIREHAGQLVSQWNDQGSGAKHLLQAGADALKPILDPNGFPSKPGIVGTQGQIMTLAVPDRDIANGIYEAYVVLKTLNFDVNHEQGPNAPANIVGSANVSAWNNFGINGGAVEYDSAAPTTETIAGSGVNDDAVHVIGVQHTSENGGTSRLYIDGVLVSTVTGRGFSTSWTGWDSILAGYLGADKAEAVLGAVIVLRDHTVPSDSSFRTKLQAWAHGWAN